MILHLTMLHRGSIENIIQLHGQNSRSTCLIGGSLRTKPEMNIPAKLLVFLIFNGLGKYIKGAI